METKNKSAIKKIIDNISTQSGSLYNSIYNSTNSNSKSLDGIKTGINMSLDNIMSKTKSNHGVDFISQLGSRLDFDDDKDLLSSINSTFSDNNLLDNLYNVYMQNSFIKDMEREIDTVCKFMPKLEEALDVRKDNVISSDHFNKDFLNIIASSNIAKSEEFSKNIDFLKKEYKLNELFSDTYDEAAKYGEKFLYIIPYSEAVSKLLEDKVKDGATITSKLENCNFAITDSIGEKLGSYTTDKAYNDISGNFKIEMHENVLHSVVRGYREVHEAYKGIISDSLSESFVPLHEATFTNQTAINEADTKDTAKEKNKKQDDFNYKFSTATDGLINNAVKKETKIKVPGAIIRELDRSNILPIYIEDLCLGYYYFEFVEGMNNTNFANMPALGNSIQNNIGYSNNTSMDRMDSDASKDEMLKLISGSIANKIDEKFVNKNIDIRQPIYMILKYNNIYNNPSLENVKVTFLPPKDVHHIYFTFNKKLHRGKSDLAKSTFAAKLYACLYTSNTLGILTRGQDKRVYYVKQGVDTNISKLLLNVIGQIKQGNFGLRQIENLNNVLNITGRFNDYVIPTSASGDSPIQFEVMQGQNIEIKTDLMNILEEMAINSTDVPLELIQARQSMDYAIQYSMSNTKFLRKVYNRQAIYEEHISDIVTKVYNYEFETNEVLKVSLPPPSFLNVTNTNQMFDNVNNLANSIVTTIASLEPDEVKAILTKNIVKDYLGTYIDFPKMEEYLNKSKQEYQNIKNLEPMKDEQS